jgi:hypothetical protein
MWVANIVGICKTATPLPDFAPQKAREFAGFFIVSSMVFYQTDGWRVFCRSFAGRVRENPLKLILPLRLKH